MAVILPVTTITFGADAQETETIYIQANRKPTYTIKRVQGGMPASYSLEETGDGYIFRVMAAEWQTDTPTSDIEDITFDDGTPNSTAILRVETRKSPSGMLYFENDYMTLTPDSEKKRVYFTAISPSGTTVNISYPSYGIIKSATVSTLEMVSTDVYRGYVDFTTNANNINFRSEVFTISVNDTHSYIMQRDFQLLQPSQKVFPCWKEMFYNIKTSNGNAEYTLVDSDKNKTIYKGRINTVNSADSVEIDLARIVRPLLRSSYDLLFNGDFYPDETASLNFSLNIKAQPVRYYMTYDNYSYNGNEDTSMILNMPIQKRLAKGQPFSVSFLNTGEDKATVNGNTEAIEKGVSHFADYLTGNTFTANIGNSEWSMTAEDWCGRYILFYINVRGGCDWLLTEGYDTMTDSMTDGTMTHPYNNIGARFGKSQYLRTITKKLSLHTGWLTDAESLLMPNLLESARVWVYDNVEDKVHPVIITDTNMTYKTFENQNRQLISYDINVEFSHGYERR